MLLHPHAAVLRRLGGEVGVWGSGDHWKLQKAPAK